MRHLRPRSLTHLAVALLAAAVAACAGGASTRPSGSPPGPSGSPAGTITSPEEAVGRVVAEHPEFEGVLPFNPDLIGGCCWYRVSSVDGDYEVVFRVGWGDCPAGCIDEHLWTYRVGGDGTVTLIAESGDAIPPGGVPGIGQG
jgi:hypothetical protein